MSSGWNVPIDRMAELLKLGLLLVIKSADPFTIICTLMTKTKKRTKSIDYPSPFVEEWEPSWLVDMGHNMRVGIALDNECYVVLTQTAAGPWRPMTHIPVEAAKMLGRLAGN
jgi:hypothetical protein